MQRRLDRKPEAMLLARRTIEHVFGTLKHWMGSTHFLTRGLAHVSTEMSLYVAGLQPEAGDQAARHAENAAAMRLLAPEGALTSLARLDHRARCAANALQYATSPLRVNFSH